MKKDSDYYQEPAWLKALPHLILLAKIDQFHEHFFNQNSPEKKLHFFSQGHAT
jgi:hypothetical protein